MEQQKTRPSDEKTKRWIQDLFVVLACLVATTLQFAQPGFACSFHNYKPAKTLVDRLLDSGTVVLARPGSGNTFRYEIIQTLKGQAADRPIPYLVDSATRRNLLDAPEDSVLFSLNSFGRWTNLGYVDTAKRNLLDQILEKAPAWRRQSFNPDRLSWAATFQNDADPSLRELALLEIDRVPYAMIRDLEIDIPAHRLIQSLGSLPEFSYRPINFLLLGLTNTQAAKTFVLEELNRLKGASLSESLGAASTALVELEGVRGVQILERLYLKDSTQPLAKLESIVEALAIHNGVGAPELRTAVHEVLARFASRRPDGAALIARQFSARQDWTFNKKLEALLDANGTMNPSSRLMVAVYVAQAKANLN